MTEIQALLFDAYGTLFDVHSVVTAVERAFPGRGKAISRLWRSKQLEYTWLLSLMGRYEDFWKVTSEALSYTCQAMELECSDELQASLMEEYLHLEPYPEVSSALKSLAGIRLAILSNGTVSMLNHLIEHAGLTSWFSQVISVDEVQIYKPSPLVYQCGIQNLGLAKGKVGFVSANYFDIAGAKAYGLRVYWVNRNLEPGDKLGLLPDEVITRLTDISL